MLSCLSHFSLCLYILTCGKLQFLSICALLLPSALLLFLQLTFRFFVQEAQIQVLSRHSISERTVLSLENSRFRETLASLDDFISEEGISCLYSLAVTL